MFLRVNHSTSICNTHIMDFWHFGFRSPKIFSDSTNSTSKNMKKVNLLLWIATNTFIYNPYFIFGIFFLISWSQPIQLEIVHTYKLFFWKRLERFFFIFSKEIFLENVNYSTAILPTHRLNFLTFYKKIL